MESRTGTQYQLDRSQFERLTMGEPGRPAFPFSQLNIQRRMRPEISTLIRSTLYPNLVDHETTECLPDVVGMRDNVFWLDHRNIEDGGRGGEDMVTSYSNSWEVEMTYGLVRHIIRQGEYSSSDIAVLAPYTGQLQKLRSKFRNEFELVFNDRDEEELEIADEGILEGEPEFKRTIDKRSFSQLLR
jgi:superfamily I DNA and/or RNA helicase